MNIQLIPLEPGVGTGTHEVSGVTHCDYVIGQLRYVRMGLSTIVPLDPHIQYVLMITQTEEAQP